MTTDVIVAPRGRPVAPVGQRGRRRTKRAPGVGRIAASRLSVCQVDAAVYSPAVLRLRVHVAETRTHVDALTNVAGDDP